MAKKADDMFTLFKTALVATTGVLIAEFIIRFILFIIGFFLIKQAQSERKTDPESTSADFMELFGYILIFGTIGSALIFIDGGFNF